MSQNDPAIRGSEYVVTLQRLVDDPVVQRMAADIRIGRLPRSKFAYDDGGATHEFMGQMNKAYTTLGGQDEGSLHFGGIAEAVLLLAYGLPATTYTVRFTSKPMSELRDWKVKAVTKVELARRILRLVCACHDLKVPDVAVTLTGQAGLAKHAEGGKEIVAFTITEVTGPQA